MTGMPAIQRLDPADAGTARRLVEVDFAATAADDPECPPWSPHVTQVRLTLGPPLNSPNEVWWTPGDAPGGVAGWYRLWLPDRENLQSSGIELYVHPAARRQGVGAALLRDAAERARVGGRVRMDGHIVQGSAGEAFARQMGATIGLVDVRRVLDVAAVPAGHVARCRGKAASAAAGYSLVSWTGRTPDKYLTGVAAMTTTMNDAPNMPHAEPDIWDEQRVRDQMDGWIEATGSRAYQVAAICDATGEMAGLTELRVDPDVPGWGYQSDTAVARPHRGHRLGLLLKAAMLQWLADAEPAVRRIVTYNAESNSHMIAINEELGYAVSGPPRREVVLDL
jgi:GNAT superfamily N-acetyltransferase